MKKIIVFLIASVLLLLGSYFFSRWFFNQPCEPPVKPKNVSANAQWFGGCDGGDWIELVSVHEKKYHFKIYRDWDGELKLDADFEEKECRDLNLDSSNFTKIIAYYGVDSNDEVRLWIHSHLGHARCYLKMISPAYGGAEWEIIKKKTK